MSMAASGEAGSQMQAAAGQVAMNADEPLDGSAAPASLESQALAVGALPVNVTYLSREYVWGTGDWGVDELLVQYDESRRASWPLQDVSGDVIALCDLSGTNASARIITQLVYDAYGNIIGRDDPANPSTGPPELRVGHKGLFFDRLDAGISDPLMGTETPRLVPGAKLSGHVRNRTLHCGLGRWNQRDPNMTGLVVQGAIAYHGDSLSNSVQGFDLEGHYSSGANVYQYAASNTYGFEDPTGLFDFSLGGQLSSASLASDIRSDSVDETFEAGGTLQSWVTGPIAGYAMDQFLDVHWASNWDEPDDLYRGSAGWSAGTGSWESSGPQSSDSGLIIAQKFTTKQIQKAMTEGATGLGVYMVIDDNGEIVYAGRTVDLQTRMKVQKIAKNGAIVVGINITGKNAKDVVRALEDLLIREEGLLSKLNKINGISDRDTKKRDGFYAKLGGFLKQFGSRGKKGK